MRLKLISCEVFARELAAAIKQTPHEVTLEFISKGWHEAACGAMRARLQEAIDDSAGFDAVLLAYGLCRHGTAGLAAGRAPLVIPRAHDCIGVLFGSRHRYHDYYFANPGTYFRSTGWLERRQNPEALREISEAEQHGINLSKENFIARYGLEEGEYLFGILGGHTRHYQQLAFIEMGVEPDGRFEEQSRAEAREKGWRFVKVQGDMGLLLRLVRAEWEAADFLVVPPGRAVRASYDERVIELEEKGGAKR